MMGFLSWFLIAASFMLFYPLDSLARKVYFEKKKMVQFISAVALVLLIFNIPLLFFVDYTLSAKEILLTLTVSTVFLFGLFKFLEKTHSAKFRQQNYMSFLFFLPLIIVIQSLIRNPNSLLILLYLIPSLLIMPFFFSNKLGIRNLLNLFPSFSVIALLYLIIGLVNAHGIITTMALFSVSFAFVSQIFNVFYFRNSADILETKSFVNSHMFIFIGVLFLFLLINLFCFLNFGEAFALLLASFAVLLYERKVNKNLTMILFSIFLGILIFFSFF